MTIIVTEATIMDMAALVGAVSRLHWRVAREMYDKGDTFAFRDGAELVAICGFYPLPDDTAEAWFCPCRTDDAAAGLKRPGARASDLVRALRLTVRRAPYRAIVAVCDREAGARIAAAIGFRYRTTTELGEVWTYDGTVEAVRDRLGRRRGAAAAGPATPDAGADRGAAGSA